MHDAVYERPGYKWFSGQLVYMYKIIILLNKLAACILLVRKHADRDYSVTTMVYNAWLSVILCIYVIGKGPIAIR